MEYENLQHERPPISVLDLYILPKVLLITFPVSFSLLHEALLVTVLRNGYENPSAQSLKYLC